MDTSIAGIVIAFAAILFVLLRFAHPVCFYTGVEPHVRVDTTTQDATPRKLRLSSGRRSILGPDGKIIRDLFDSEIAGISLWDTFHPGYADEHMEEMIYGEEEVERILAWIEKDKKEREHFIAWWKSASYEQRLVVVKRWYDALYPHIRAERAPAEDVANIGDISSDRFLAGALAQSEARSRGRNISTDAR